MDPLSSVASLASSYSASNLAADYSMAVARMAMDDAQELAMQELERMLPPSPYTFDVYA